MSWQDSFIPDGGTPQAVQAQGWQSSFVPDSQSQQPVSNALAQTQTAAPNPSASDGNISIQQQMTSPQEMYKYFSDKPNTEYANILPYSTNKKTGDQSIDFPEAIRAPMRGLAELLSQARGQLPAQTDTSTGSTGSLSPDALQALMALSPVSPGSTSFALGQNLASGIEATAGQLPKLAANEYENIAPSASASLPLKNSDLKLITDKLDMAGITPQQYADALVKSSPDEFAAEVGGDPLKIQAQSYAKLQGPTMQAARDAMRQRLADAPTRTQALIDNTFTSGPNIDRLQDNMGQMQQSLPALYGEANKDVVPSSVISTQLNTPAGQTALQATAAKLANKGISPQDSGFIKGENGLYSLDENVPVGTLHEFSKSLGDQVQRNPLTGAIEDSNSLAIEGQRQGVTSALSQASPAFAKANNTAAAYNQAQSAFDAGRKLAHTSTGDNADQLMDRAADTYSPNELSYHKAGFAQGLTDKTLNAPLATGNPATRIANGAVVQKAGPILDNPSQAQAFGDALVREKQMMDFANRGLNNSVTAETASAAMPEIPTSAHGIALSAASKIGDFLNAGKNQRMSQLLFSTSPQDKQTLADALIRYSNGK